MLFKLNEDISECYERAAESRHRADLSSQAEMKAAFLRMERRWLQLAKSYEFVSRLEDYLSATKSHLTPRS